MIKSQLEKIILFSFYFFLIFNICYYNLVLKIGFEHIEFEELAHSFLQGHLYLGIDNGTWMDASYYKGLTYWPQGVFPAILMTPIIAVFRGLVHQNTVHLILNLLNIILLYKIALSITKNKMTSLWLAFAYIGSTTYLVLSLVPWSWWFAQIVATTVMLLSIYEYLHKRRYWLIGIYIACGFTTRIDLIFTSIFFILMLYKKKHKNQQSQLIQLLLPLLGGIILIMLYNYFRFGSPIEFGYTYHIPSLSFMYPILKTHGTWSLFYYPINIYYFFFKGPEIFLDPITYRFASPPFVASPMGLSIFITSPIFIWCFSKFRTRIKEPAIKSAFITVIPIILFLLGYFSTGTITFGPRYALDFSPFLFIILCYVFRNNMGRFVKIVIVLSFLFNFYFFPTVFNYHFILRG